MWRTLNYYTHLLFVVIFRYVQRSCLISFILFVCYKCFIFFCTVNLLGFELILDILNHTCRVGMPWMQAPSALHSCSHTRGAPGAQRVDSQMGPAPEPRLKGHPPSMTAVWRPDSSLSPLSERWRASSAGLRGKYNV